MSTRALTQIALTLRLLGLFGLIALASMKVSAIEFECVAGFDPDEHFVSTCDFEVQFGSSDLATEDETVAQNVVADCEPIDTTHVSATPDRDPICEWEDELCGWATHDSCPISIEETPCGEPASTIEQSVAAAATAACAHHGISLEQIVEPFAMVGPHLANQLTQIREFDQWWANAIEAATSPTAPNEVRQESENDESEIDALAAQEPVDVDSLGPSVLNAATGDRETAIEAAPTRDAFSINDPATSQVGASAVIVTLDDAPLPYDVSAGEIPVWSFFPLVTQPFCVRGCGDLDSRSLWYSLDEMATPDEVDASPQAIDRELQVEAKPSGEDERFESETVQAHTQLEEELLATYGSIDCVMYEVLYEVEQALDKDSSAQVWLEPKTYGERFGAWLLIGQQVAAEATQQLADAWPQAVEPTVGEQLLARAGATAETETESSSESVEQVDEVPTNSVPVAEIAEVPATSSLH